MLRPGDRSVMQNLLIIGGTISSGQRYTFSVTGWYWMSSNCSHECTTPPGVTARSRPTSNASAATIDGTRGGVDRSETRARKPRTTLWPPVSMSALAATGLSSGLLLGAAAAIRLLRRNLSRVSSRQPSSAPASSALADVPAAREAWTLRLSQGLPVQAGSEKRRSRGAAVTADRPAVIRPSPAPSSAAPPPTTPRRAREARGAAPPERGVARREGGRAAGGGVAQRQVRGPRRVRCVRRACV